MTEHYRHLGIFSDLVSAAKQKTPLYPLAKPGAQTQTHLRDALGFYSTDESPQDVRIEKEWTKDGIIGQEVSWSVGYGPRTYAYVFKPAGVKEPLPGVLALHDHSDFKFYGKEKIAGCAGIA